MAEKKWSRYRLILCLFAILFSTLSAGCLYYIIWQEIPSVIRIPPKSEQTLEFYLPVSGKLYKEEEWEQFQEGNTAVEASKMGVSRMENTDGIDLTLKEALTFKADATDSYKIQLNLFGMIPFKTVDLQVAEENTVIPVGIPIGIYIKTQGVLVIDIGQFENATGRDCSPAQNILHKGDYILKVNGKEVSKKTEFIKLVEESDGEKMSLVIRRGEDTFPVSVRPEKNTTGEYKIGVWVRDSAQGIGTLTYIDKNSHFGALGHGINDADTSELMEVDSGALYQTDIVAIKKGTKGEPGELTGVINYAKGNVLGIIEENTAVGIYGTCSDKLVEEALAENSDILKEMKIGYKQEVQTGPAQILTCITGKPQLYDVEIIELSYSDTNINRGIVLQITDPELLSLTGGIVQGLSGSPLIQNNKLVGAVTHVFVQNPTKGYAIFAENMMK